MERCAERYEEYAEKLTAKQLEGMSRHFIKPLTDRRKLARHTPWAGVNREQQERVKNKTDAVQQQFYRVRYLAGVRCNQARRLYAAVTEAIAFVEKTQRSYPHEFSYEETVQTPSGRAVRQRVELTLWDAVSVREHAIGLGYARGARHHATETLARRTIFRSTGAALRGVQRDNAAGKNRRGGAFWFLELFRHRVFRRSRRAAIPIWRTSESSSIGNGDTRASSRGRMTEYCPLGPRIIGHWISFKPKKATSSCRMRASTPQHCSVG